MHLICPTSQIRDALPVDPCQRNISPGAARNAKGFRRRQDRNYHISVKPESARTTSLVRCDMSLCANMGYKSGL
jgi:hypothetical protein